MRAYDGGGITEESYRRNYEEGIMDCRIHHSAGTQEEAAKRRQPGGGSQEEAARRLQEIPWRHQQASGRQPGSPRSVSVSVSVSVPILLLVLGVFHGPSCLRAAGQHSEARDNHKCMGWQ